MPGLDPSAAAGATSGTSTNGVPSATGAGAANPFAALDLSSLLSQFNNAGLPPPASSASTATETTPALSATSTTAVSETHVLDSDLLSNSEGKSNQYITISFCNYTMILY